MSASDNEKVKEKCNTTFNQMERLQEPEHLRGRVDVPGGIQSSGTCPLVNLARRN